MEDGRLTTFDFPLSTYDFPLSTFHFLLIIKYSERGFINDWQRLSRFSCLAKEYGFSDGDIPVGKKSAAV